MGWSGKTNIVCRSALSVLVSVSLIIGLVPGFAQADTSIEVKAEGQEQVNETVVIEVQGEELDSGTISDERGSAADRQKPTQDEIVEELKPTQIAAVATVESDKQSGNTLLLDGLIYDLNTQNYTAVLTGWYGEAPKDDLSIPTTVSDGKALYTLKALGGVHIFAKILKPI